MVTRIIRLVLIVLFVLPWNAPAAVDASSEMPYHAYLPLNIGGSLCQVIYQNPTDDTIMRGGSNFQARWTIKNTSANAWDADLTTLRFVSGDRLHLGEDIRSLPYDVAPGGTADIIVTMSAPNAPGSYTSNWAITQRGATLCNLQMRIKVQ